MIRDEINIENAEKIPMGNTAHKVNLYDNEAKGKECNKKCNLLVRKGLSKDPKYNWYLYWSLELKSEQGNKITWTPTRELFMSIIEEFLIHESRNDITRKRNSDTIIYKERMNEIKKAIENVLKNSKIPEIYKKQEIIK